MFEYEQNLIDEIEQEESKKIIEIMKVLHILLYGRPLPIVNKEKNEVESH